MEPHKPDSAADEGECKQSETRGKDASTQAVRLTAMSHRHPEVAQEVLRERITGRLRIAACSARVQQHREHDQHDRRGGGPSA